MPVEQKTHHTLCRMCDEHCGIDVRTEGGYIVEIVGNKAHPSSHGKLCVKARAAMDMVYHPQRLLKPLKRTDGGWSEISLEQALDEIGGRLSDIEERFGSRSISVWKGEAVGFAQQEALARRFIHALGSPNYLSNDSTCFAARHIAYKLVEGGWPVPDFENAR